MRVRLATKLVRKLKKQDVRLRKGFKTAINLFSKDPHDLQLDNHELQREWEGFRSIDITSYTENDMSSSKIVLSAEQK